mmetsp:Transcript_11155/g.18218  ORF Transcript_11155/g.18218 Transcript_11155/m.18218 type:complete len:778 (+) Transcript_11155:84-2417(+)|eukprot:CAMPEP_0114463518 /NCGR_PEP_ID=MMETSP0104-20121206/7407_1 /TAXON_ID=37642 ORGANISM="Paraphysomonas imperforata, Strain PA2" /NCGR_SAMPLE_ID=MMETSP0104 /ASSEMBLY_ACC=CAM_ASM_000202 /LENGTH=777 /DNA_ID=CAMNT_0001636473 /DNA_START=43 /DNA_END=2376 /DNA_ORIENTATION=+
MAETSFSSNDVLDDVGHGSGIMSKSQLTMDCELPYGFDKSVVTLSYQEDAKDVHFQPLAEKQVTLFTNTLPVYRETEECKQELRQTCLVQKPSQVTVHVAREDFLHIRATITVSFIPDAAQGAWADFLDECRNRLGIDFIDSVYDKFDHSPVHRVLRLQEGGHYVIRQREESSVLEVIQSGVRPGKIVWPITKFINTAKDILDDLQTHQPGMENRVERLVNQPQLRSRQRKICQMIIKSSNPEEIMKIMLELVEQRKPKPSDPPDVVDKIEKDNKKKIDSEIDYISIYRIFLETLNRVALRGYMEEAGENSILTYILNLIERLKDEVDIVVLGMKLMSDMVKSLALRTDEIFHVIMNCVQKYSPPPQPGFIRVLKRNIPSAEELERRRQAEDERLAQEAMEEEERNTRELNAKLLAKEKAAEDEKKAAVATKVAVSTVDLAAKRRQEANRLKVQKRIAKAEKRAKEVAERRRNGGAPILEGDEGAVESSYLPPVKKGTKTAKVAAPKAKKKTYTNPTLSAEDNTAEAPKAVKKAFKLPENSKRRVEHIVDPDEEKRNALEKQANQWEGLGENVAWDDDDVRKGDYEPLPVVEGVKFVGITGDKRKNLAFTQCVMTMGKFCFTSAAFREYAFSMRIHEELCDVGLVCQHLPTVLTFIIWITDKVLQDQYNEELMKAQAAEARQKAMATATKNDDSESNLSIDSNLNDKKNSLHVALDQHIANVTRPEGNILLFFAMCVNIHDLESKPLAAAHKWLELYDDETRAYKVIRRKGMEMADL